MKTKFYKAVIVIFVIIISLIIYLNNTYNNRYLSYEGQVFGTQYAIEYQSNTRFNEQIDSIFSLVDASVNYYNPRSEINQFNSKGKLKNPSAIFLEQLKSSKEYNEQTNGAFEPTLTPLIELWGFGFDERKKVEEFKIDSLLQLVSFKNNIAFNDTIVKALRKNTKLNFTAMGEGYTLNKIAEFLDGKGVENYKIEIGGEVKCKGTNKEGEFWKIGIENPYFSLGTEKDRLIYIVNLKNTSISTSGSYRKYYIDSTGKRRPHIINPKTGYPVDHSLLSVSIKCRNAEKADAFATACMVLGQKKAKELIQENKDLEGLLIFDDNSRSLSIWKSENF